MSCLQSWPEPVVCVQSLAESGISKIPLKYVKPPSLRAGKVVTGADDAAGTAASTVESKEEKIKNIPIIDFMNLWSEDEKVRDKTMREMSEACKEWGFFHLVNHGISSEMIERVRKTWREFFNLPLEVKKQYANSPLTYEGYGSRLGVEKGAILDWSDYFFLNYMPKSMRNPSKWPSRPPSCRKMIVEYGEEMLKLCGKLMKCLSVNLGLDENHLGKAFGIEGEEDHENENKNKNKNKNNNNGIGACMRANLYPKCPEPELTLGLSSHSDPGGITILLADNHTPGLQVRKGHHWITVQPIPNAFIVNIGDQIQVLSNAIYKSVEHRVTVNSGKERESLAFFYNPKSDLKIEPLKELVSKERPALYPPMTYHEYRLHIRLNGPTGKSQVESLKCI